MKFRLNKILLFLLVVGIMTLTGCSTEPEGPMEKAEAFLKDYYTVEDSELADFFYEEVVGNPKPNMDAIEEFGNMLKEKYGPLMTEEGFEDAMANRFIPGGDMFARDTGIKMVADSVTFVSEQGYQDGRMYYKYQAPLEITITDGEVETTVVLGEIAMKEVEGEWKVDVFRPDVEDLSRLVSYGVSNLRITNWDVEDKVGKVEVSWEGSSSGATNADGTGMGLGTSFEFRMPSEENLIFSVKLFDTEDKVLVEYGFETNFSSGRNFELYIMWDANMENVVLSESYDSAIIGGADGPTEIVVVEEEGEFQRSVKMTLQKVVDGQVERTVEIADSCSVDTITEVVMDHMIRSAAWEGIELRELEEYYILIDHLAEEGEMRESYIYIDQGEIYYQNGLDGRRSHISQESYESIRSFFKY